MKKSTAFLCLSGLFLISCGGGENTESNEDTDSTAQEVCAYSYDPESTELTWTAFKLTDKIGVSGTFDQIDVVANDNSEDMFGVLSGATFDIPVLSLNSQDPVRDPKLKNSFFGNMEETASISGTITTINESEGSVQISMNGTSVDYKGEVKVEGETITFLTTIDILDFNGQVAMDSLSVVCAEKHTGEDGVNKLWTDVDIAVKTTLVKTCE